MSDRRRRRCCKRRRAAAARSSPDARVGPRARRPASRPVLASPRPWPRAVAHRSCAQPARRRSVVSAAVPLVPAHDPTLAARIELDAHGSTLLGQPLAAPLPLASCHENLPHPGGRNRPGTKKPRKCGAFTMRRRGLEPPPGYPGPGPQPCNPGVRSVLCVHASRTSTDLDTTDVMDDLDVAADVATAARTRVRRWRRSLSVDLATSRRWTLVDISRRLRTGNAELCGTAHGATRAEQRSSCTSRHDMGP